MVNKTSFWVASNVGAVRLIQATWNSENTVLLLSIKIGQLELKSEWHFNIFRLTCVKLRIFKGVFARVLLNISVIAFLLLQLRLTNIICWLYPGGKVCVTGGHMTSRNQGLSPSDKGGKGERARERGWIKYCRAWIVLHIIHFPLQVMGCRRNVAHHFCTCPEFVSMLSSETHLGKTR